MHNFNVSVNRLVEKREYTRRVDVNMEVEQFLKKIDKLIIINIMEHWQSISLKSIFLINKNN